MKVEQKYHYTKLESEMWSIYTAILVNLSIKQS